MAFRSKRPTMGPGIPGFGFRPTREQRPWYHRLVDNRRPRPLAIVRPFPPTQPGVSPDRFLISFPGKVDPRVVGAFWVGAPCHADSAIHGRHPPAANPWRLAPSGGDGLRWTAPDILERIAGMTPTEKVAEAARVFDVVEAMAREVGAVVLAEDFRNPSAEQVQSVYARTEEFGSRYREVLAALLKNLTGQEWAIVHELLAAGAQPMTIIHGLGQLLQTDVKTVPQARKAAENLQGRQSFQANGEGISYWVRATRKQLADTVLGLLCHSGAKIARKKSGLEIFHSASPDRVTRQRLEPYGRIWPPDPTQPPFTVFLPLLGWQMKVTGSGSKVTIYLTFGASGTPQP